MSRAQRTVWAQSPRAGGHRERACAAGRKRAAVSSQATYARRANGASRRLARPTTLFGSMTATGTPRSAAASETGPEAYPPTLRTAFGRTARTSRSARVVARAATKAPRGSRAAGPPPFIGSTSSSSSRHPRAGTTRASTPRRVPQKTTSTSAIASSDSATRDGREDVSPGPSARDERRSRPAHDAASGDGFAHRALERRLDHGRCGRRIDCGVASLARDVEQDPGGDGVHEQATIRRSSRTAASAPWSAGWRAPRRGSRAPERRTSSRGRMRGSDPKSSGARSAARTPRATRSRYAPHRAATPMNPSSSPMMAATKSVWASGKYSVWRPRPMPEPGRAARPKGHDALEGLVRQVLPVLVHVQPGQVALVAVLAEADGRGAECPAEDGRAKDVSDLGARDEEHA